VENFGKPVETSVGSPLKTKKNIKTKDICQNSPLSIFYVPPGGLLPLGRDRDRGSYPSFTLAGVYF
jgi:hypothetical protein